MDTDFLDSNQFRAFPLVENPGVDTPNWMIVDMRVTILGQTWDASRYHVYLAWIARLGDRIRFGFRTDHPQLLDQELIFERSPTSSKYLTTFSDSQPLAESIEEKCGCSTELLCNANLSEGDGCSDELLCNPSFDDSCGPELLCNARLRTVDP